MLLRVAKEPWPVALNGQVQSREAEKKTRKGTGGVVLCGCGAEVAGMEQRQRVTLLLLAFLFLFLFPFFFFFLSGWMEGRRR